MEPDYPDAATAPSGLLTSVTATAFFWPPAWPRSFGVLLIPPRPNKPELVLPRSLHSHTPDSTVPPAQIRHKFHLVWIQFGFSY